MNRLHKLRKLQLEMEGKSFPEGLAKKTALFEEAQKSGMQSLFQLKNEPESAGVMVEECSFQVLFYFCF